MISFWIAIVFLPYVNFIYLFILFVIQNIKLALFNIFLKFFYFENVPFLPYYMLSVDVF